MWRNWIKLLEVPADYRRKESFTSGRESNARVSDAAPFPLEILTRVAGSLSLALEYSLFSLDNTIISGFFLSHYIG